jgi:hypothetical protein
MRRRAPAQSMVEMAFVLPFLFVVLFGIIEFSYLIFAYSTISQAARNGAEQAAQVPPHESWLNYKSNPPGDSDYSWRGDPCTDSVMAAIERDLTIFGGGNGGLDFTSFVTISYPEGGDTRNLVDRGPIEVRITYPVQGITPLFQLVNVGGGSGVTMQVIQRRSLENLGVDPTKPQGVACARDMAEYRSIIANP